MKKINIILCILAVFVVIGGIVAWMNFDNIKAIYKATQYNTEEIENQMVENEKKNTEILEKYNQTNIKPLSEEESAKLTKGELTEEEAINLVLGKTENTQQEQPSKPDEPNQTQEPVKEEQPVMSAEDEERLGALVAKIYVLKGKYNQLIADENHNAASDFYSLPKEQQTKEKKYERGLTFMRNVLNLQSQCDAEMEAIFKEMTELLTKNNMSLELVDEIRKAYEEEKELKKAYFVNKYTE